MSALEARGVSVQRGERLLVEDVDLRIEPGEFHAIIGPNGSGKSTILRALSGIWRPSAGAVLVGGRPVHTLPRRDVARALSYVPQDTRVDFSFTVHEIASMGRYAHRGRFERETETDRAAVERALIRCDVAHLRERSVNTLSGGERQRVVIARGLAAQPTYLLLDEPTANLDVRHSLEVFDLCRQLSAGGQAVVVATHDLAAAARYADRMTAVDKGRIVATGTCAEVLTEPLLNRVFGVGAEKLVSQSGQTMYVFTSAGRGN